MKKKQKNKNWKDTLLERQVEPTNDSVNSPGAQRKVISNPQVETLPPLFSFSRVLILKVKFQNKLFKNEWTFWIYELLNLFQNNNSNEVRYMPDPSATKIEFFMIFLMGYQNMGVSSNWSLDHHTSIFRSSSSHVPRLQF